VGGVVEKRQGRAWVQVPKTSLLNWTVDSALWDWLRSEGLRRPSPRGTAGYTTPEDQRPTVQVKLRLAPSSAQRLKRLAKDARVTVSALIERWIDRG
jgi:hypothetical protein